MKNFLLAGFLTIGAWTFGQTYCIPEFSDGCDDGDQIDNFEIPSIGFSHLGTGCSSGAYGDFTSQTINLNAGVAYPFTITHGYENEYVRIWIDFNNDGTFDETTELVASSISVEDTNGSITNSTIVIPLTVTPGTYRMRVADKYDENPVPCNIDGYGEAHDYTVVIGAAPSCLAPSALTLNSLASNAAEISWTAPISTVGVGYEYYLSTSATPPLPAAVATGSVNAQATSTQLPNLSPTTLYYVWVRSVCSTSDKSMWSLGKTFYTPCAATAPTYTNDFSTYPVDCWTQASDGTPATGPTGVDEYWYEKDFLNSGADNSSVRMNVYSENRIGWLKTIPFNLSAGGYKVSFDYGVTDYNNANPSGMGSDDTVQFLVSVNGGVNWTVLQTWNAANAPSNTSTNYSYDLSSYTGNNTVFAFYGSSGTVDDDEDYEFFVDNFTVESSLAVSEINKEKYDIKVHPNPFTEILNITKVDQIRSISVSDLSGKQVKSFEQPVPVLYLGDLSSGIYLITLHMKDGSKQVIKTIKK
ncbi:GEVED domain-containing protein [Chryseobacterium gallinarum]|uniref:T9SS type A sorting domain-containing protein n=1 Tax=Chryseobacterium gallinarum TaxID=1324352 RepID=A0ABX6KPK6_CHRGL|nr:GEVED domain-containing protein [Chryseobacterium gallinarum]QIY90562.1 T9SS type A sorting domain-containing protein [Chryseobacterium gallinarum]